MTVSTWHFKLLVRWNSAANDVNKGNDCPLPNFLILCKIYIDLLKVVNGRVTQDIARDDQLKGKPKFVSLIEKRSRESQVVTKSSLSIWAENAPQMLLLVQLWKRPSAHFRSTFAPAHPSVTEAHMACTLSLSFLSYGVSLEIVEHVNCRAWTCPIYS